MATKIVSVTNDRGIYDFVLGARAQNWGSFDAERQDNRYPGDDVGVEIVENLVGWDGWEFAARIDGYDVFIGRSNPEKDQWPEEIAKALATWEETETANA